MTLDIDSRMLGRTDQIPYSTAGMSSGEGTFTEGEVTGVVGVVNGDGRFHVRGAADCGYYYRTYVDSVCIGYDNRLHLQHGEQFDLTGLDFKLGTDLLELRPSRD